jgi:hypothetical protein
MGGAAHGRALTDLAAIDQIPECSEGGKLQAPAGRVIIEPGDAVPALELEAGRLAGTSAFPARVRRRCRNMTGRRKQ